MKTNKKMRKFAVAGVVISVVLVATVGHSDSARKPIDQGNSFAGFPTTDYSKLPSTPAIPVEAAKGQRAGGRQGGVTEPDAFPEEAWKIPGGSTP